jgi:DNA-binding IclR family transcriptional regulator
MMSRQAADPGALERALDLMRLLATAGGRGTSLTELSQKTGLPHPTVHRLLQRLVAQQLVRQLDSSRKYALGPLAFELGIAAAQQFDMRSLCRPSLQRVAQEVGDTAYLVGRSGSEAVCLDRQEGPSPIRVFTLEIGSRRPLGLGAAGLAILGALGLHEREAVQRDIAALVLRGSGLSQEEFAASVAATAQQGYSFIRNRVTLGVSAVGVAVMNSLDQPIAAISVAAIDARMTPQRISIVTEVLRREARAIADALKRGRGFAPEHGEQ